MKAVFLSYNQALTDRVNAILDEQGIRGFTKWALTEGRGSVDGEPHYGTHAWPSMNASILAIVDDEKVAPLMPDRHHPERTAAPGRRHRYRDLSGSGKSDGSAVCERKRQVFGRRYMGKKQMARSCLRRRRSACRA